MNLDELIGGWKKWLPAATVELVVPWQNAVTGLELISNYWQPALNGFCMVLGSLASVAGFAVLRQRARYKNVRTVIHFGLASILSVIACFSLQLSVGTVFFPESVLRVLVWLVWIIAYLSIFVCSGISLSALGILLGRGRE